MRRTGWQRIGIVASILWVVAGFFIGNKAALDAAERQAKAQQDSCISGNKTQQGESAPYEHAVWLRCWPDSNEALMQKSKGHWWIALAFAAIPLPFGWLFGWLSLSAVRRVRGGFQNSN
jgi:hypothetical protein